ncbi:10 kDa chaperonin [Chloropicon roscoffensis]|uniref:10 kDa chaperonin n=2 Tax=Chloropicon roscoffensis TaxID=1461544 RepID=A0AAX4PDJ4_9CHLO
MQWATRTRGRCGAEARMAAVAGGRVSGHAALGRRAHVASRGGIGTTKSRRAHPVFECRATAEAEKTASLAKYQTVGDRFLVTLFEREAKTDGGILLSAKAAENKAAGEKLLIGTVHAVPEDTELKVKAGDKILFAKYGSTETRLDDADVYFVRSGEVLAVLE